MTDQKLLVSRGLCENCLHFGDGIVTCPVGPRRGTIKDPEWETLQLCEQCYGALKSHNLRLLGERYKEERPPRAAPTPLQLPPGGVRPS